MNRKDYLIYLFQEATKTKWKPSQELNSCLTQFLADLVDVEIKPEQDIMNCLIFLINTRLKINKNVRKKFIDRAAIKKVIFNYHEKIEIDNYIDDPTKELPDLIKLYCKNNNDIINLSIEAENAANKNIIYLDDFLANDHRAEHVIESIFCSFIYYAFDEKNVHISLNSDCKIEYKESFFDHLIEYHPNQISRENGLSIINLDSIITDKKSYENNTSRIFSIISNIHKTMDNHSYLALIISDVIQDRWSYVADATIFAEKHLERKIDRTYFRYKDILNTTKQYIPELDIINAHFELGNEGFHYKDCYVITKNTKEYILLLFEKNDRDEQIIPCPKCRTKNVQGNSYPKLGVRSWECNNPFCGDKSKYNRGKRYSLVSIIRQEAIKDHKNLIDIDILKKWRRDIVNAPSDVDIFDFIIKCYSLYDDKVHLFGDIYIKNTFGRIIIQNKVEDIPINTYAYDDFQNFYFFKRFILPKKDSHAKLTKNLSSIDGLQLYCGDSYDILSAMPSDSIDGAVTSPPYYNAREYSQWPNIYCYLYDMYNIARQVYRVLSPGNPYLFNIFDYFDNEKNIVFSAMGEKRLTLSSYISYIFRKIGFKHIGNCAWDKGEIQGKRNFNQGNLSPYYQAPHNCWEHIMLFSKGTPNFDVSKMPKVICEKPVFKISNGINTYGHSAPYPKRIPQLLFSLLKDKDTPTVLDPFSGSMTTGRAAYEKNIRSVNIELHQEYCDLSLEILKKDANGSKQLTLL